MVSILSWIDPDFGVRNQVLEFLNMPGVVDELGFGTIRDSVSDTLFPGVSTLHTRLRYVLIIKWIYEISGSSSKSDFDSIEQKLISDIAKSGEPGAFGKRMKAKRLTAPPSYAYGTALRKWNIFSKDERLSLEQISRYSAFDQQRQPTDEERKEGDYYVNQPRRIWNENLPAPPEKFPKVQNLQNPDKTAPCYLDIPPQEAAQLHGCMENAPAIKGTLFGHLLNKIEFYGERQVFEKKENLYRYPWDLLKIEGHLLSSEHQQQLKHAEIYSQLVYGVTQLYYLLLAETKFAHESEKLNSFQMIYQKWWEKLNHERIYRWSIEDFLSMCRNCPGHKINEKTVTFFTQWVERLKQTMESPPLDDEVRKLVETHETAVKGNKSRFIEKNINQWNPDTPKLPDETKPNSNFLYNFRWSNVQTHLRDLYNGLSSTPTQANVPHAESE